MLSQSQVGFASSFFLSQLLLTLVGMQAASHDSEDGQEGFFNDQLERTRRLFEIISARSDIDHPVCSECAEMLVEGMQKRLVSVTKERDAYVSFLREVGQSIQTEGEEKKEEELLEETLETEKKAFLELEALEREKAAMDEEIAGLEEESRLLDVEEEKFWRERNAFDLILAEFQQERDAMDMRYEHDLKQTERLQRTNVYNDAFMIGHDGYFGTINGLRLGKLANPSVEWTEINAAWGQTALLLVTIAEKLGFEFRGYRVRPLGSLSRIDRIEQVEDSNSSPSATSLSSATTTTTTATPKPKVTTLDLFSSGDLPLNLPWIHRRFDAGMVAFLECLRQLGEFMAESTAHQQIRGGRGRRGEGVRLPYEIKRDKIHDTSIKLGFINQNDETWTRACKYTLTCCKYLLAHASNLSR